MINIKEFFKLIFKGKNIVHFSLFVILMLLLFQSTTTLFWNIGAQTPIENIDIIFRTALSSIFGYIISTIPNSSEDNVFLQNPNEDKEYKLNDSGALNQKKNLSSIKQPKKICKLQIILISSICIYCLLVLFVARNFSHLIVESSSSGSTLTLYRDFVSASIGALIGLSKS